MTCGRMNVEHRVQRGRILSMRFTTALGILACLPCACGNPTKPTDTPPPFIPSITEIAPSSAMAGRADLAVTITGNNFVQGFSGYTWAIWSANGTDTVLRTIVLSSTQLSAIVPAALLSAAGEAQMQVVTGDPQSVSADPEYPRSNAVSFEITPGTFAPGGAFPPELIGTYQATFSASASCASGLPEAARERTYTATFSSDGSIRWSGPTLHPPPGHNTVSSGQLVSTVFSFMVDVPRDPQSDDFHGIWDEIGNGAFLNIAGKGIGQAHSSEITGTFNGLIVFYGRSQTGAATSQYCNATDHRFTFVKE